MALLMSWLECQVACARVVETRGQLLRISGATISHFRVQGGKALLVGDARAFLSTYQALAAAGLRAAQLDRAPALQVGAGDADTIAQVTSLAE